MARKANRANAIEKEIVKLKEKENKLLEQLKSIKEEVNVLEEEYKQLQAKNVLSLIDKYNLDIDEVELLILQEVDKKNVERSTEGENENEKDTHVDS